MTDHSKMTTADVNRMKEADLAALPLKEQVVDLANRAEIAAAAIAESLSIDPYVPVDPTYARKMDGAKYARMVNESYATFFEAIAAAVEGKK